MPQARMLDHKYIVLHKWDHESHACMTNNIVTVMNHILPRTPSEHRLYISMVVSTIYHLAARLRNLRSSLSI